MNETVKPISPLVTVQKYLAEHKDQLAAALPKHLNADRMARLALTALSQNRKLAECDAKSIFGAVVVASQLGLEIGVVGQCYLVPYKGRATLVPGWQGLVDLVGRAGRSSCWTGAVFEGDEFEWQLGDQPFVRHRPGGESEPKKITHVYAIGRVNKAEWPIIEVWPMAKIWKHRDKYNKVGKDHYSFENPEMYARKVALLQVLKYLPKSIEISAAMEISYRAEEGRSSIIGADFQVLDDGPPVNDESPKTASITSQIKRASERAEQEADATPDPSASLFADRLTMIKDAENGEQLDYVLSLDVSALEESQIASINHLIATKRERFAR